ncbi:MAG: hypothetical protein SchgKO_23500 [Schleiferiaceae bacterium]
MKRVLTLYIILWSSVCFAQSANELFEPTVEEGYRLYKAEMAAWHGSDLFNAKNTEKITPGGYVAYPDGEKETVCVFFDKEDSDVVIFEVTFDEDFTLETADIEFKERKATRKEKKLFSMRSMTIDQFQSDTLFKFYQNTSPNIIPISDELGERVYVLTGPQQSGVILFGNDYLLTFDDDLNHVNTEALHKSLIAVFTNEEDVKKHIHTHLPDKNPFMTATDLCTILLYSKYCEIESFSVISEKYLSWWDRSSGKPFAMTREALDKIERSQDSLKTVRDSIRINTPVNSPDSTSEAP